LTRKSKNIGPDTFAMIEVLPVSFLRDLVLRRETDSEPGLAPVIPAGDFEDPDEFRMQLISALDQLHPEDLLPLEDRCRRIRRLAEGKGPASLDMLVKQCLSHEQDAVYAEQPDPSCRSAWCFLHHPALFEDAVAFDGARQFRDHGQMYNAFEVDVEEAVAIDAASLDEAALAACISELLALPSLCTVRAINLARTQTRPASLMIIIRHPGPLSSVFNHKNNGLRGAIYYRPPNEATLIWTAETCVMEICARSPDVRQKVGEGFARTILQHDVSNKPLTWRFYDLSRFRNSLSLPIPQWDDCRILTAQLTEIELRLGNWSRRLSLKVGVLDDIERIARRYLGASDVFRRAEGFSRVRITVQYERPGESRRRALNIDVGYGRSNLQSRRDPHERDLGYRFLDFWGILNAFKQLDDQEAQTILPQLLALHDLTDDEITGAFLREIGLDAQRLAKAGIIELRGRQTVILMDEEDHDTEVRVAPGPRYGAVRAIGAHGEDLGILPEEEMLTYALRRDWLEETILKLIKPAISRPAITVLDEDLLYLGRMKTGGGEVPVHLARRLTRTQTLNRLDVLLRSRQGLGVGIVLAAGPSTFSHLGPNIVLQLADHLGDDSVRISMDSLEQAFQAGRLLALGGTSPFLVKSGPQTAMLYVPGKPPLAIHGRVQILIFERLVAAHTLGSPEIKASQLLEDTRARSPSDAFPARFRAEVMGIYLVRGSHKGFWRLAV
jgi:hypothetical protein